MKSSEGWTLLNSLLPDIQIDVREMGSFKRFFVSEVTYIYACSCSSGHLQRKHRKGTNSHALQLPGSRTRSFTWRLLMADLATNLHTQMCARNSSYSSCIQRPVPPQHASNLSFRCSLTGCYSFPSTAGPVRDTGRGDWRRQGSSSGPISSRKTGNFWRESSAM